jgi:predicted transcriptional regulator YheO
MNITSIISGSGLKLVGQHRVEALDVNYKRASERVLIEMMRKRNLVDALCANLKEATKDLGSLYRKLKVDGSQDVASLLEPVLTKYLDLVDDSHKVMASTSASKSMVERAVSMLVLSVQSKTDPLMHVASAFETLVRANKISARTAGETDESFNFRKFATRETLSEIFKGLITVDNSVDDSGDVVSFSGKLGSKKVWFELYLRGPDGHETDEPVVGSKNEVSIRWQTARLWEISYVPIKEYSGDVKEIHQACRKAMESSIDDIKSGNGCEVED